MFSLSPGLLIVVVVAVFFLSVLLLRRRWHRALETRLRAKIENLSEAAEFAKKLIENSPDGFVVVDAHFAIVQVNEAYCRMTGRSKKEFIGRTPPLPGWPPEEREHIEANLKKMVDGEFVPFETSVVKKDGSRFPAQFNVGGIQTTQGNKYYFGIIRDLTKQKAAEAALQENEARFRTAIESLPFHFFALDKHCRYIMQNTAVKEQWGDIIGKRPEDVGADEETVAMWNDNNRRALAGETVEGDVGFRIRGEERIFHNIISPVKSDGKIVGILGVNIDITELAEAERSLREQDKRLQMILGQIPTVVWSVDRNLMITMSIGAGLKIRDLKPGELLGTTLYDYFGTNDPDFAGIAAHRRALEGETVSFEVDWFGHIMDIHIDPLRDEGNEIIGCLAVAHDVSERIRTDEEIKRSREQLRALAGRLHQVREEESAIIARAIHDELGQALTGLRWDLSRCAKHFLNNDGEKDMADFNENIDRMTQNIDATVQRVREISSRLRPPILDDFGLVGAIEWQTDEFQKRTGIRCDIDRHGDEELDVKLDAQRSTAAFRIFQEILTNVVRHAHANHVRIALGNDANGFRIEVQDNGVGMCFENTEQIDGLGILGMRERAVVFGGEVSIQSTPGEGTRVRVIIPNIRNNI